MFYPIVAHTYYKKVENFDNFVNYLKDKNNTDKILNWLQEESRFDVYNHLLEIIVDYLKQNDFVNLDDITNITNMMLKQSFTNAIDQRNKEESKLPELSLQEFDHLFYKFLQRIDAPENWQGMYDDLKANNRIIFKDETGNQNSSSCYHDSDGTLKILVPTDGTIKYFCNFVHEFTHYVTMQNEVKNPPFSVLEFPSIFFEKVSAQFLKEVGYNDDIVDHIINDRFQSNMKVYTNLSYLFNDINRFINVGPIERNKKIAFLEKQTKLIRDTQIKLLEIMASSGQTVDPNLFKSPEINIPNEVDKECDYMINSFIQNGLLVIDGYQYLLDTYLADEILSKTNDDLTIIPKMIKVTNNLSNINISSILTEFDMPTLFSQSKDKSDNKKTFR